MSNFASRGFAAHTLSLRGHGLSEGKETLWHTRIADYVEDVVSVAEKLPEPPVVIGHSLGGFVVQKYLEIHSAPAGVLIASSPPNGILRALIRLAIRHPFLFLNSYMFLNTNRLIRTPLLTRKILFSMRTQQNIIMECLDRLNDEALPAFLDNLISNHVKPALITAPMLIIGSNADYFFNPLDIYRTAKTFKTDPVFFESMGHDMMLEEGWQNIAEKMILWMKRCL